MKDPILIIGGTGTTGTSLVELLKGSNANYRVLVRKLCKSRTLTSGRSADCHGRARRLAGDRNRSKRY